MKYGKLIDGAVEFAPNKIKNGNSITYNPTVETLTALGYMPVIVTDAPQTETGYQAVGEWVIEDGQIVLRWHIETAEPTETEILSILLGGAE